MGISPVHCRNLEVSLSSTKTHQQLSVSFSQSPSTELYKILSEALTWPISSFLFRGLPSITSLRFTSTYCNIWANIIGIKSSSRTLAEGQGSEWCLHYPLARRTKSRLNKGAHGPKRSMAAELLSKSLSMG